MHEEFLDGRIVVKVGDLTAEDTDAIVNAANSTLLGGGGVDGAIHRAGGPNILAECRNLRDTTLPDGLPAGDAVATTAGDLLARWVIHTVGPVHSTREDRSETLVSCYRASLRVLSAADYDGAVAMVHDGPDDDEWGKLEQAREIVEQVWRDR